MMNLKTLTAAICGLFVALTAGAAGKKISDYTETLTLGDAWIYEIAVPGVTNYKVTFGAMATNIAARVNSTNTIIDGSGNLSFNSTNDTLQLLDTNGAYQGYVKLNGQSLIQFNPTSRLGFGVAGNTNWYINNDGAGNLGHYRPTLSNTYSVGSVTQSVKQIWVNDMSLLGVTAARPLFLDASGNITNVSGTPNGSQFVRDDGVLAVPGGGGDVTTAQLNTSSNALFTLETTRNGTVSNAVVAFELTRNAAVSNALVALIGSGNATNAVTLGENLGLTNSVQMGVFYQIQGVTNIQFRTVSVGNGLLNTNQGTNIVTAINPAIVASQTDLTTASNSLRTVTVNGLTNKIDNLNGRGTNAIFYGNTGIGATPVNTLDVEGALAVGAAFSGTSTAPANGAIIEGNAGIGTASPASAAGISRYIDISSTSPALILSDSATPRKWEMFAFQGKLRIYNDLVGDTLAITSAGNVGFTTITPTNTLDVNGHTSLRSNVFLPNLPTNGSPIAFLATDAGGAVYETAVPSGSGSTQMVVAAIGNLNVTNTITANELSVVTFNANTMTLTNALGSNQVRLGYHQLTNIVRRQSIYVDAGAMISNATAGASFFTEETSSPTNRMSDSFLFSGAVTNIVQFRVGMPENWNLSTVKVKLWTSSTNNIATTTNVWAISAAAIKSDSVITNIDWGTELTITNTVSSIGGRAVLTPATPALTIGNSPTAASLVWFRIRRLPGHADDNDGGLQKLLAAWVQYGETMSEVAAW